MDLAVEQTETHDGWRFRVTVNEGGSATRHEVTLRRQDHERLAEGTDPARLVRESFRYLLEREPKEAILDRFDLTVIERYFPGYAAEISDRLTR